jgi:hypothetical protein
MENEIILYQNDAQSFHLEVRLEDETVWLTQQQMAVLFNQTKQNISLHIRNCFREGELLESATVKDYLTVQKEGDRDVKRKVSFYSLDVIISVGYRVKSKQGTQFRIWAGRVLKDYLLKGYSINNRMNRIEDKVEAIREKVQEIDLQIKSKQIPNQAVFFDGQIFDAYELASRIIRSAKEEIILIDHYIDENTFLHLAKKQLHVKVILLTKAGGKQVLLDLEKINAQYGGFELKAFIQSHDRFLIIDRQEIYHLGASLKDLGKRWFAFSRLESQWLEALMKRLEKL